MFLRIVFGFCALALVAACEVVPADGSGTTAVPSAAGPSTFRPDTQSARAFAQVTTLVEPIAERECSARTSGVNCDFRIVIDDRPNQPSNAYQFLDRNLATPLLLGGGLLPFDGESSRPPIYPL